MKKAIAMLLATVMCTAMLTGCGSDSAANESSQASGSSVAETAAATTTDVYKRQDLCRGWSKRV